MVVSGTVEQVVVAFVDAIRQLDIEKPAVGFDVDDTLIRWQVNARGEEVNTGPISPIRALFDYLTSHGYRIYLITARLHVREGVPYMMGQLREAGYDLNKIADVKFTPKQYTGDGHPHPGPFKYDARRRIMKEDGVTFVGMVGDKFWDMYPAGDPPASLALEEDKAYLVTQPDDHTYYGLKLPSR
jgi:hypothetical protein